MNYIFSIWKIIIQTFIYLKTRIWFMRLLMVLILLPAALVACEKDPDAYYTCFGGVKVSDLAECDFSTINFTLENCDKVELYDTGMIITDPGEVISAFQVYESHIRENLTFVNSKYYKMIKGTDYYRFNFFHHGTKERLQFFIDGYGVIYQPQNCRT